MARDTRLRRGKKSGKSSWRKCRLHQDLKNKLESAGPDRVGRGEGSVPEKRHSVSKDWRQQEGGSRKPPGFSTQAPSLRKQSQRNRGQATGSCWKGITVQTPPHLKEWKTAPQSTRFVTELGPHPRPLDSPKLFSFKQFKFSFSRMCVTTSIPEHHQGPGAALLSGGHTGVNASRFAVGDGITVY